ncbi:MAG: hypothetical protein LBT47_02670 [Deltaproteobacteria bacterium]|nr:hypothetical protein [Deltaproteobacteria bacterium]
MLNSPAGAALVAMFLCWLAAVILPGPIYMVSDDCVIRGRIEGKLINGLPASEFAEFLTISGGRLLRFLYDSFPGFYWYDLLWYAFLSISVFAIVYILSEKPAEDDVKYKIFVAFGLPIIFSVAFIALQFTIVAGFLTISAVAVFISIIRRQHLSFLTYFLRSIYIVFALSCAGLIRMDAALAVTVLSGFLLFPFLPWKKPLRLVLILIPPLFGWLGIIAIMHSDTEARKNHSTWNYWNEFNKVNVALVNNSLLSVKSNRWETLNELQASELNFHRRDDFVWDGAHYMLLINYHFLDDTDGGFALDNLKKVAAAFTSDVKIAGKMAPRLRFEKDNPPIYADTFKWFKKYLWVFGGLVLIFRRRAFAGYTVFFLAAFWVFGSLMGLVYRPLPLRLLYPLAILPLICLLLFAKSSPAGVFKSSPSKNSSRWVILKNGFNCLAIVALIVICGTSVMPQYNANNEFIHDYQEFNKFIPTLDRNLIYGLEYFQPYLSRPFKRYKAHDLGLKIIYFSSSLEDKTVRNLYASWYSATGKNNFRELFNSGRFRLISMRKFGGLRPDILYFMRQIHNKRIAVLEDKDAFGGVTRYFACYQYVMLNKQEVELRDKSIAIHYSSIPDIIKEKLLQNYILNYIKSYDGEDLTKSLETVYNFFEPEIFRY